MGKLFETLVRAGRFVCGMTTDTRSVICWTIGADQPEHGEIARTSGDELNPAAFLAYANPEHFTICQSGTKRYDDFYLFFSEGST